VNRLFLTFILMLFVIAIRLVSPAAAQESSVAECRLPLPELVEASEAENIVWSAICDDRMTDIDLSWFDDTDLPCNPAEIEGDVPDSRKIRGEFLELILGFPTFSAQLLRPSVSIRCAQVTSRFDLSYRKIQPAVFLTEVHFLHGIDVSSSRFVRSFGLSGSTVDGRFDADRLHVADFLFLRGGGKFNGRVNLGRAIIGSNLEADGSTFEDEFNGNGLNVGGNLFLRGGAKFHGKVNLGSSVIGSNLEADGSTFEAEFNGNGLNVGGSLFLRGGANFNGTVNLGSSSIGSNLEADGSIFEGELDGDRLNVDGSLFLRGGAKFYGRVKLGSSVIGSNLEADGSTFEDEFNGDGLNVGGSLFLRGGAVFKGAVILRGAKIGSNLEADGSIFEDEFNGGSLIVGQGLFLRGGAVFKGAVILRSAKIGGSLSAIGSTFEGELDGGLLNVDGGLFLRGGATFKDKVKLLNAQIGSNLEADGSNFEEEFNGGLLNVGGSLFLRSGAEFNNNIILRNSNIVVDIEASGSVFRGDILADGVNVGQSFLLRGKSHFMARINLVSSRIGSHLQFGGSRFDGEIDFTGSAVGDEILISSPKEIHGRPNWGTDAKLIFRNTKVKALQAEMHAWQREDGSWVETDLTGFEYDRLGGLNAEMEGESPNMADAESKVLVAWIEKSQKNHEKHYDPQPYKQLADALESSGAVNAAKHVRHARYEYRRRAETTPVFEKILLFASNAVIGHGYFPTRVFWWFGGLVAAGVLMAHYRSKASELDGWQCKFWYSVENTLPLVELKESHKNLNHEDAWAENFFHTQKILGFALATILVGVLTLLGG
jgi:hypothetical protein